MSVEVSEYYTLGYNLMCDALAEVKVRFWKDLKERFGDWPEYSEIETGALDAEYD